MDPSGNEMNVNDLRSIAEDPKIPLDQFNINTNCFGRIVYQDDKAIILSHYVDGKGVIKFKTIPKSLIRKTTPYKRNNRVNLHHYWRNQRTTKRRRLVEVDWRAPTEMTTNKDSLIAFQEELFESLLIPTMSYGVVASEDPDALILKHYENDLNEREVQIIPQSLIKRVTPFYSKRK